MVKYDYNSASPFSLLIVLGIVWGSSFILIAHILPCYTPIQYALLRVLLTGLCLSPWCIKYLKTVNKAQLLWLFSLGALGYFISYLFMGISQKHISSSLAGILSSLAPLFTFILGTIFFNHEFKWKNILGISLGLIGCLFIVLFRKSGNSHSKETYYMYFMFVSVLSSAIALNISQSKLKGIPPLAISSVSFGTAGILALIGFLSITDWSALTMHPQIVSCTASLLCLSIVGTALASLDVYKRQRLTKAIGAELLGQVENHHNFAWKEMVYDQEAIVHRKGATPASEGTLGIIPGSMTAPGFLVRGRGELNSINSASHGACLLYTSRCV